MRTIRGVIRVEVEKVVSITNQVLGEEKLKKLELENLFVKFALQMTLQEISCSDDLKMTIEIMGIEKTKVNDNVIGGVESYTIAECVMCCYNFSKNALSLPNKERMQDLEAWFKRP